MTDMQENREYPYWDESGNLVWACCISRIGPICNRRKPPEDEIPESEVSE